MDRLLLVRGVNTSEDDHGKGQYLMLTGRRQSPAEDHPRLGAVVAKATDSERLELPGHIHITPGGGGGRSADAAYLGPQYASVVLGNGNPPAHTALAGGVTEQTDAKRHALTQTAERSLSRPPQNRANGRLHAELRSGPEADATSRHV